nr:unnamed protein product [Callosobruchus analis]
MYNNALVCGLSKNNANGDVSTLDGDLAVGPNVSDGHTDQDVVKFAECIHQDADGVKHENLVKSEYIAASEGSQVQSEDAVEDSKTKHVEEGCANGEEDDLDSVWSNETVRAEMNRMDDEDVSNDCDTDLELTQTQTIQVTGPIEANGENQNEKLIVEASQSTTEGNDQDTQVSGGSSDTLTIENNSLTATDLLVDTKKQGVESDREDDQMMEQQTDMSDKYSNKVTNVKSKDNEMEDTQSLDILVESCTPIDCVSDAEDTLEVHGNDIDIGRCDGKLLTDKHDKKVICEENKEDVESQGEESTEKEPAEAVKSELKPNSVRIAEMDSVIVIDDDSSDEVESQKELQMACSLETVENQSTIDTASELGEKNVDPKGKEDIENSSTKESQKQSESMPNMDVEGPVVEDAASEDSITSSDIKNDDLKDTSGTDGKLQDENVGKLLEENLANEYDSQRTPNSINIFEERDNTAGGSIDMHTKSQSSPQVTDTSDSDTVTYDIEEALSKTDIDKVHTRDGNKENDIEQAEVDHTQIADLSVTDSDATCIDSSQITSKSDATQIPTVTVHHMSEKDQMVSKSAEKSVVSHSRPESKLSDCDSFVFDLQACSQNESVEENPTEVETDLKQAANETVESKDMDNAGLSRCDVLESALPDLETSTKDDNEESQLVDVVMEEILENSDNSAKDSASFSRTQETETAISVKEEPADRPVEEDDGEEEDVEQEEEEGAGKLGDELLELFREVKSKKDDEETAVGDDVTSAYESDDADAIFRAMEEDSTDTTDSDSDAADDGDISISDDSDIEWLIEDKSAKTPDNEEIGEQKHNFMNMLHLKETKMDRCLVRVERADLKKLATTWRRTETQDSIERLCDLSTINNKKAAGDEQPKPRHRKKRKKFGRSSNSSEDIFDSSSCVSQSSDVEIWTGKGSSPDLSVDVQKKLDAMLAAVVLKGMEENSTDTETDSEDTDDEDEKNKKKKRADRETKGSEHAKGMVGYFLASSVEKVLDYPVEIPSNITIRDDDPDYQLDFDQDSDDGLKKKRMSYKDDNAEQSSELSDDSSAREKNRLDDTTDDSDVEFVFKDVECSSPDLSQTQKGHRRNIRALMSDADLERATLLAKEAEEERIGRLKCRQKLRETLSQSLSATVEETPQEEEEAGMSASQTEEGLVLDVDEHTNKPLVQVAPQLTKILKSHQKAGIQFMWDCCYESLERIKAKDLGSGCILAHCMGLGKTLQVLALIHTLFAYKETGAKHALVVCPLSTVSNWRKEVRLRLKDVKKNFEVFTIGTTQEIGRQKPILKQWYCAKRSILIMGYERYECLTNEEKLNKTSADFRTLVLNSLVDPGPDLIVCDEGHLLRSKKSVKVQALNKFVKPNLLGNLKEFKTNFINPITNGQYEDSTKEDIKLMKKRTHVLHNYLKQTIQRFEDTELQTYLKKMHHYAVFVQLHPVQVEFYKKFLDIAFAAQREEQRKMSKQKGFFRDYAVFQYISTHPYLLKIMEKRRNSNEREQDVIITDDVRPVCNVGNWWKDEMPADAENAIEYGTKMLVVRHILEECEEIGDKVLIFSQSLGELDLIEHFLKNCGTSKCPSWKKDVDYTRMDGTVKPESRTGICDRFNEKSNTKLRYHEQQAMLANRPEDDLNEQEKLAAWEEFEKEKNMQKAAKEAAAMAATFAKEAAAASAEAMAALAATSSDRLKAVGAASSSGVGSGDHHPGNNEIPKNGAGQPEAVNTTGQAKNNKTSSNVLFAEALEQLANLTNRTRVNQKSSGVQGGQFGASAAQTRRSLHKQQQPPRPRLSQQVDETPIDLTMVGSPEVVRRPPKDPLATCSNGTENVLGTGAGVPKRNDVPKPMLWIEREKANLIEHLKNQNQKENQQQQQLNRLIKTFKRNRDIDAASKAAQMDHAYSATKTSVKRKSDHLTAGAGPEKKARNTVLRMNPCALLQPASAKAMAAASKTIPEGMTTINLSDDEVEVVAASSAPPKPPHGHDAIINSLSRSGITVTTLAPSNNRTTTTTTTAAAAAAVASSDEVIITLE